MHYWPTSLKQNNLILHHKTPVLSEKFYRWFCPVPYPGTGFLGDSNTIFHFKISQVMTKQVTPLEGLPANIRDLVTARAVTYRGTGLKGPGGTLIRAAGIEYLVADQTFNDLGGIASIRFAAPERKHR